MTISITYVCDGALPYYLTQELLAVVPTCLGALYPGPGGSAVAHLPDDATSQQQADALTVLQAHDPVILTASRDGSAVTLHISKPNNVDSATGVTLVINGVTGSQATPLTSNEATITITSADTIVIGIDEAYPHDEVTI